MGEIVSEADNKISRIGDRTADRAHGVAARDVINGLRGRAGLLVSSGTDMVKVTGEGADRRDRCGIVVIVCAVEIQVICAGEGVRDVLSDLPFDYSGAIPNDISCEGEETAYIFGGSANSGHFAVTGKAKAQATRVHNQAAKTPSAWADGADKQSGRIGYRDHEDDLHGTALLRRGARSATPI
jgi:hypothetical protein